MISLLQPIRRPGTQSRLNQLALIRTLTRLILAAVFLTALGSDARAARSLRIAVVHDDGTEGTLTWQGVVDAVDRYAKRKARRFDIELLRFPYASEAEGLEILLRIVDKGDPEHTVDLVIGPTDSGIFLDLAEHEERLRSRRVPIISSLVTADVPNAKDGWLFRTNVNAVLRVNEISEFLGQRGFGALAVLYADTEFGKLAEQAFAEDLPKENRDFYMSYPYRGVRDRQPLRTLLQDRPGAVGVFGQRFMIRDVRDDLRALNRSWYEYDPVIFSIIDARAICEPGIFFVSFAALATDSCKGGRTIESDEVYGLAFDTTEIVLEIAEGTHAPAGLWAERFRARFSKALNSDDRPPGEKTGLRFAARENRAPLGIFTVKDGAVTRVLPARGDPAVRVLKNWFKVRWRRFGLAPVINVLLIVLIVGAMTFADAGRWHTGSLRELPRRHPFRRLVYFNVGISLLVFTALSEMESGPFRWDGLFGALVVAFGYPTLLKTTILETPSGQRLGLSGIYDRTLRRINERIMAMRFDLTHEKVGFIAHTNALESMKETLRNVYRLAKTRERRGELTNSLEDELGALPNNFERKKLCAERLLGLMDWEHLQKQRLVPQEIPESELIGPDPILRASRDHCLAGDEGKKRLDEKVEQWLNELKVRNPDRATRDFEELGRRIGEATTERGMVYARLQYLFSCWNYDLDRIERAGLIGPDFRETELTRRQESLPPSRWQRARTTFARLIRR